MENLLESTQKTKAELCLEVENLQREILRLREKLAWFKRQVFGAKKETFVPDGNTPLLPGMELPGEEPEPEEPETKTITVKPRKKRGAYTQFEFPATAPREEEIIDIPEEEKEGLVCIGEDVTERLALRRARFVVKVTRIKKYVIANEAKCAVHTAKSWTPAIPGSRMDESLLADILVNKYANHLPLYRICQMFGRDGLVISRQTLSKLVLKSGSLLEKLGELLEKEIMACARVFTDDTTLQLQVKGKGKTQTARIWIRVGGDGSDPPLVFYNFSENRKEEHPLNQFKDYKGSFHSDAFQTYEKLALLKNIIWQPCWAHARRKFFEAKTNNALREKILNLMDKLFAHEKKVWELEKGKLGSRERLAYREENSRPLVDEIFATLKDALLNDRLLPRMKITGAVDYLLKRETHFRNFLTHSELRIDNNVAERNIRPLAIGRKNWLFVGSKDGGKAAATLLSLIQTCKNLEVNPTDYLTDVLRRINNIPEEKLPQLLPQNWKKQ
jgi:transposase